MVRACAFFFSSFFLELRALVRGRKSRNMELAKEPLCLLSYAVRIAALAAGMMSAKLKCKIKI